MNAAQETGDMLVVTLPVPTTVPASSTCGSKGPSLSCSDQVTSAGG